MTPLCEHRVNIIAGHGITVEYGYRTAPSVSAPTSHIDRQAPTGSLQSCNTAPSMRSVLIARQ
jgi:hypothetical protein